MFDPRQNDKANLLPTIEERKNNIINTLGGKIAKNGFIRGCLCPHCGEKEAYSPYPYGDSQKAYWKIICPRENNCGVTTKYTELFPIEKFTVRYNRKFSSANEGMPDNERGKQYLRERGFNEETINKLEWGTNVKDVAEARGGEGAAILFRFADGKCLNGRIYDPNGSGKSHSEGEIRKTYWKLDGYTYEKEKPTYVTESPIKALAKIQEGYQALAFSSSHFSEDNPLFTDFQGYTLKAAFDSDEAGRKALKRFAKIVGNKEGHIEPPQNGKDWDDYLFEELPGDFLKKCQAKAGISLAENIGEWVKATINAGGEPEGIAEFNNWTYHITRETNQKKQQENGEYKKELLYNGTVRIDHFIKNGSKHIPVITIQNATGEKVITYGPFEPNETDLKPGETFKETLRLNGKMVYLAQSVPGRLIDFIYSSGRQAPSVLLCEKDGYQRNPGCWVFQTWGMNKEGKFFYADERGFVSIDGHHYKAPGYIKHPIQIPKGTEPDTESVKKYIQSMYHSSGEKTLECLGSLLMGLVKDIVAERGAPFLALIGPPATGKSSLLKQLNALVGIDQEGITPGTPKGVQRALQQTSGLPLSILEIYSKFFEPDSLLTFYNDSEGGISAQYTSDSKTQSFPVYSTPVFSSNEMPTTKRNFLSRVILIRDWNQSFTEEQTKAFNEVEDLRKDKTKMPGIVLAFIRASVWLRKGYQAHYDTIIQEYKATLKERKSEDSFRHAHNHAVITACLVCFYEYLELGKYIDTMKDQLKKIMVKRLEESFSNSQEADEVFEVIAGILNEPPTGVEQGEVDKAIRVTETSVYIRVKELQRILSIGKHSPEWTNRLRTILESSPALKRDQAGKPNKQAQYRVGREQFKAWEFDKAKIPTFNE